MDGGDICSHLRFSLTYPLSKDDFIKWALEGVGIQEGLLFRWAEGFNKDPFKALETVKEAFTAAGLARVLQTILVLMGHIKESEFTLKNSLPLVQRVGTFSVEDIIRHAHREVVVYARSRLETRLLMPGPEMMREAEVKAWARIIPPHLPKE